MTSHTFSHDFTIGIEEELLLVDSDTRNLSPVSAAILRRIDVGREMVDHELYAAQLELRSGRCITVNQAIAVLRANRSAVRRAGGVIIGSGLHPSDQFGCAELVGQDRYERVGHMFRGLVSRTPEAALHIHIGLPDEAAAMRVFNGIREYLPLFAAVSANSPWWFGVDSGLASSRAALVRAYPTRGIPPILESYEAYRSTVAAIVEAAGIPDYTFMYWDVRLHPRFGTVEIREMDAQSRLEDVAAIAALAQCLSASLARADLTVAPSQCDVLSWSSFRAARDGVDARIWHEGRDRPVLEVAAAIISSLSPVSRELGCEMELASLGSLLADRGGAGRQRAVAATEGVDGLLRSLMETTT
jgi:glutamate---cysteine ligase / carboxylate-amine ligase